MPKFNDFDLDGENWKQLTDIWTDSLWVINEREKGGKHSNYYHGNFVPQIANQFIKRYTKKGDFVLDMFLGSGTTSIECENLGRNIIGVDIKRSLIEKAQELITSEDIKKKFIVGDSGSKKTYNEINKYLFDNGEKGASLVLLHPPYHDIIKFSDEKDDLSNAISGDVFLKKFYKVVENSKNLLNDGGYLVIVIGDKYSNGEWIPLGFQCMNEAQKTGLKLKSIIVKNMEGNRAKIGSGGIWRYRALTSDYYIFKHEYIFVFKK